MASIPRVLIYGGKGALGSTCISYFTARNWVSYALVRGVSLNRIQGKIRLEIDAIHRHISCIN